MKRLLLISLAGLFVFSFNSCKKDVLDLDENLKFSKLTVEQQKQKVEDNGLDFLNSIETLKNSSAVIALENLNNLFGNFDSYDLVSSLRVFTNETKNGALNSLENFGSRMKVVRSTNQDFVEWGKFVYSFYTHEFEKVESYTNKLVIQYPATENSKTNNATFTLNYTDSKTPIPDDEGYFPEKMTISLTVDGKEVMSGDFKGSYHKDSMAKSISTSLKIGTYSWSGSVDNTLKKADVKYEFKNGSKLLMKTTAEVEGDLTYENFDDDPNDAVSAFAMSHQVLDIGVRGGTKYYQNYMSELEKLDKENLNDEKKHYDEVAKLMNKYFVVTGYFVKDGKKFADVEFYTKESTETSWEYDYNKKEYVEIEYSSYELAPRFVLSDGSKVDAEEYFENGFQKLMEKLDEMFGENGFD